MRPLTWIQLTATALISALLTCASASAQVADDPPAQGEAPTMRGAQVVVDPSPQPRALPLVRVPQAFAPPAPPPPVGYVWNVIWTDQTEPRAVRRLYPERAERENVSGSALIDCLIVGDGSLTDCRVVSETPPGFDFGAASLELARHFRAAPQTSDGRATDGMRVRRNIRWAQN